MVVEDVFYLVVAAELVLGAFLVLLLLRFLTRENPLPFGTYVSVFLAYYLCAIPLVLLPGDIVLAFDKDSHAHEIGWVVAWQSVFWLLQLFSWIVLPIHSSYLMAGEFVYVRRLWRAVKENLILYLIIGAVVGALLFYVAIKNSLGHREVIGLCIASSNAFGLLIVITLLGYGLVEWPRSYWHKGNIDRSLQFLHFQAVSTFDNLESAEIRFAEAKAVLREADVMTLSSDPMRPFVDRLLAYKPELMPQSMFASSFTDSSSSVPEIDGEAPWPQDGPRRADLIRLHRTLRRTVVNLLKARHQWEYLQKRAVLQQGEIAKRDARKAAKTGTCCRYSCLKCSLYRLFAVILACIALVVLWCEVTISVDDPSISPLYVLFDASYHSSSLVVAQVVAFLFLAFVSGCAYWTLFRLRVFQFYSVIPHHTDGVSLLFSGLFGCRVVLSVCTNFLHIAHVPSGTAFEALFGSMSVIPLLGDDFNRYFPIVVILLVLFTLTNLWSRMLSMCNFRRFDFKPADSTGEEVEEGRQLLEQSRLDVVKTRRLDADENMADRRGTAWLLKFYRQKAVNEMEDEEEAYSKKIDEKKLLGVHKTSSRLDHFRANTRDASSYDALWGSGSDRPSDGSSHPSRGRDGDVRRIFSD
eukprot:TRINITY_DN267_c4_g1_i1.p1 TRINITY_DN267_c4_g1~~TRINITY_DN267_c4_g1_i1.p1  ORF type:complete len:638 (-),score=136.77 TRINITY_DN267_c4_g1_i1:131-2044(-)